MSNTRRMTVDPTTDPAWLALTRSHRSDVFHSPAWLSIIRDVYGFDVVADIIVDDADRPVAGLCRSVIDDAVGRRIVSMPFSDFCDPLVTTNEQWEALTVTLPTDPWTVRCLRDDFVSRDVRFEQIHDAAWHAVDTTRDPDVIWDELPSSARRAIRRGRSRLEIRPAETVEDLGAFFDLHRGVRRHKYGLLAQPRAFFESIWEAFIGRDASTLLLAWADDDLAGGILFVEWNDTLYYKFNASHPDHLDSRPNDLALWEGICHANRHDLARIDMGVSDFDQPGLVAYKEKYATESGTMRVHRTPLGFERDERASELRSLLSSLTDLFTDPSVPDDIVEEAGTVLYRYFV